MESHPSRPGLLERLSALLSREPESRNELLALLHAAYERNLVDADALTIIEGALQVSDMQVRDVMVPRARMDVIHIDDPLDKIAAFVIDTDALTIIEGALQVSDMQVRDVMVPRARMDVIHIDDPLDKIAAFVIDTAHSRFPAVGEGKDDVLGIFLAKDLLRSE